MVQKSGVLRRHHSWLSFIQRLLDVGMVFALLPTLCVLTKVPYGQPYQIAAIVGTLLTWVMMGAVDLYRPWRGTGFLREIRVIFSAWVLVVSILFFVGWGMKFTETYSRLVLGSWFVLSPLAMAGVHAFARIFLRVLRRQGRNTRTAIIVGAGDLGQQLARRILDANWMGVRILGFFDDAKKEGKCVLEIPVLGKSVDVLDYVNLHCVDQVYLALPMRSEARMRGVFDALQDSTACIYLVPDLFIFELMGARMQDVAGLPVFSLCESPFTGPFGIVKRMEDVLLASLILLLIWPLMLLIAVGVRLSSPGAVLFRQYRYGLNGRRIRVYKFRSMTVCEDGEHVLQAKKGDARVTCFGAFLTAE